VVLAGKGKRKYELNAAQEKGMSTLASAPQVGKERIKKEKWHV